MKVMLNTQMPSTRVHLHNTEKVSFKQKISPEMQLWLYKVYSPFIEMLEARGLKMVFDFCEKQRTGFVSVVRKNNEKAILSKVYLEKRAALNNPGDWIEPINTAVANVVNKGIKAELEMFVVPML